MAIQLIKAFPEIMKPKPEGNYLKVSELFYGTIQGEGVYTGHPAVFLRLQDCTLNCVWCDTRAVWKRGNPYSFAELFDLMHHADVINKLHDNTHLVITGGSPLLQQDSLIKFIKEFEIVFRFIPFIEIENECTISPKEELCNFVKCWNNSPKLLSSGNTFVDKHKPDILIQLSCLDDSWFKFVVENNTDWFEIKRDFIDTGFIKKNQIILMPLGGTKSELESNREAVVQIAIRENVRYSTREHVVLWDKMTGV